MKQDNKKEDDKKAEKPKVDKEALALSKKIKKKALQSQQIIRK